MGLIRLVREHTDFPIHKYAAHVIRKVSHHPVTGVWRAEGWKTGEQHRFRLQIRRVLGTNVDINRLFERLQPARWTGDDIADAFWTFFLRNVYGATAFPDVVDVKRELLVKKNTLTTQAGARSASAARASETSRQVRGDSAQKALAGIVQVRGPRVITVTAALDFGLGTFGWVSLAVPMSSRV